MSEKKKRQDFGRSICGAPAGMPSGCHLTWTSGLLTFIASLPLSPLTTTDKKKSKTPLQFVPNCPEHQNPSTGRKVFTLPDFPK